MAIRVFDGFDHYDTIADLQARVGAVQWSDVYSYGNTVSFPTGRGGYGRAIALNTAFNEITQFGGSFGAFYDSAVLGFAVLLTPNLLTQSFDLQLMDYASGVAQLTARFTLNAGLISVYSGDPGYPGGSANGLSDDVPTTYAPLLGTSPPNAFSPFIWNFIEISTTIGDPGTFTIQVNGSPVVSGTGPTGLLAYTTPTNAPATTRADFSGFRVRLGPTQGVEASVGLQIDDFYLLDTTAGAGAFPANTFLGDTAVRTLYTTGQVSAQWTPLASTNWVEVGESQFDGDASYNSATEVGSTDVFTFSSLPTGVSAVYAVQTTGAYRKQDAGANTITQGVVSGGTSAAGTAHELSLGYGYYTDLFVLDPHTGAAWTPSAVNMINCSYELSA